MLGQKEDRHGDCSCSWGKAGSPEGLTWPLLFGPRPHQGNLSLRLSPCPFKGILPLSHLAEETLARNRAR